MNFAQMSLSEVSPSMLAWVLTYAVHSSILLSAAWLLSRRAAPAIAELLWKGALIGALFTATMPQILGTGAFLIEAAQESTVPVTADLGAPAAALPPTPAATEILVRSVDRVTPWLIFLWAVVALLFLGTLALSGRRVRRLLAGRRSLDETPHGATLVSMCWSAGIRRRVRLSVSDRLTVPVALGILRPEICLPQRALDELDEAELRAVLAHELAHLARRDPLWRLLARTVEGVFFFQPLNYLAARRLRQLSEYLADDWTTSRAVPGPSLARCLATVARWTVDPPRLGTVPGMTAGGSELERRVRRLLDGSAGTSREPRGVAAALVVAVLALGFLAPSWSAAPLAGTEETQDETTGDKKTDDKKADDKKADDEETAGELANRWDEIREHERRLREQEARLEAQEKEMRERLIDMEQQQSAQAREMLRRARELERQAREQSVDVEERSQEMGREQATHREELELRREAAQQARQEMEATRERYREALREYQEEHRQEIEHARAHQLEVATEIFEKAREQARTSLKKMERSLQQMERSRELARRAAEEEAAKEAYGDKKKKEEKDE